MLKISIPFFAIFIFFSSSYSQSIDYYQAINVINQFSKSAVYVQSPQVAGTGTLFVVPFNDTSAGGITYVATARHVLIKTDSLQRIIGFFDTVLVYMNRVNGPKESRRYQKIYTSDVLDVAILAPIEHIRPFSEYDTFVPSVRDIAKYYEIKKAQTAFIAGYPFAIGTEGELLNPVIQQGIIAQVDSIQSRVLIDIPVNPGNSGCPVYILAMDNSIKLIGLVFEYQPNTEDLVIRPSIKGPAPANASLGRVVLLQKIIDILKILPH